MATRDEIWEQIKNDKEIVYDKSMLDMFLDLTEELNVDHYEELPPEKKRLVSPEWRLQNATSTKDAQDAIKDGAKNFTDAIKNFAERSVSHNSKAADELFRWIVESGRVGPRQALNNAAHIGNIELMNFSVIKGDSMGETDLNQAASWATWRANNFEAIEFLMNKGVDVGTMILEATANDNEEVLSWIMKNKKIDMQDKKVVSGLNAAFIKAAERLNHTILRILHKRGIPTNREVLKSAIKLAKDEEVWVADQSKRDITVDFLDGLLFRSEFPQKGWS
jgi:hypothetical protein